MQAETTRTRFRRSCGFSWDRSVIATAPHSQQLLGPHFMDGRHPGRPELKPQFRPSLFGLQHRCCTVRGPVLHLRVPYFRPTFTAGELSGQLRTPYLGFCAALQALSIAFVASRHACFGLTIVQMHGPSPPGWAGCLDDLILEASRAEVSVRFRAYNSKQATTQIRPPAPLSACLLWVIRAGLTLSR